MSNPDVKRENDALTPDAVLGAAPGAAPDAAPGAAPDAAPGAAPDAAPGVEPDAAPGVEPGAAPGVAPGVEPDAALGAAPDATSGAAPGVEPDAAPGVEPDAASGATPDTAGAPPVSPEYWGLPILELLRETGVDVGEAASVLSLRGEKLAMPGIRVKPEGQPLVFEMRIAMVPYNYNLALVVERLIDDMLSGSPTARASLRHELSTLLTTVRVGYLRAAARCTPALRGLAVKSRCGRETLLNLKIDPKNATMYFLKDNPQRLGVIMRWEEEETTEN